MRKKPNTTKKAAAPAGPTAKPATPKKAPARPAAAKPKPKRTTPPAPVSPSTDAIATRAYYIAEQRRAHGQPGDEQQDWIEAERQLRAEASGKKRPSKSKAP